ncbi:MAG: ATPase, T2SS/T4P/T4SS family, partial [Endomicrobiia bacterium]
PFLSKVDEKVIYGYLSQHESGISVISDIEKIQDIDLLGIEEIKKAISLLKNAYSWNIFNIEKSFNERLIGILDLSDIILLIIEPNEIYLEYTNKIIDFLKSKHFPVQILKIVIAEHKNKNSISDMNIQNHIGMKIFSKIIYDNSCMMDISKNEILLLTQPHSEFSISIKELSNKIVEFSKEIKSKIKKEFYQEEATKENTEEEMKKLRIKIHDRIIKELEKETLDIKKYEISKNNPELYDKVKRKIQEIVSEECEDIYSRQKRIQLVNEILDIILGLGPLEPFLKDPSISEIMVNGKDKIYIEKNGKIFLTEKKFDTEIQLRTVIDRILSPIGRRVDESSPIVDARLLDGSRVNIIIPPVSLNGQCITIRKFTVKKLKISDLISLGSLTENMANFLEICVRLKKNIIVVGGTGSGKTTLLNMLSSFIPSYERIITIEDSAELDLAQEHVVRLEARPPSIEGTGEITIRRLVINALRMRPDRIIVGECRGPEALDMLQAMNTGHEGSLTTIHANSPRDAILRLITMVIMAGTELPEKAIRDQIISAIDIIVHVSRLSDGSRKILSIGELIKDRNSDEIKIGHIFTYEQTGVSSDGKIIGEFKTTNYIPSFYDEIEKHGLKWEILN